MAAQPTLRGGTAKAASPATPQARSVRTAAETAVAPALPQSYIDAERIINTEYGGSGAPPSHQGAANYVASKESSSEFMRLAAKYPDNWDSRAYYDLKKYLADVAAYNALVASGPSTRPKAATAPAEERSPSAQVKRRGSAETVLTAGWGLDDKPKALAKTLLGQ